MNFDLQTHGDKCTPLTPCKACLVTAHLRQALSPFDFDKLVKVIQGPEAVVTPIATLELSVRTDNALRNNQILTVDKLITCSEPELMRMEFLGRKSVNEIREVLAVKGLHLASEKET